MVSLAVEEDLRLPVESTEGGAVNDPVTIPLVARTKGMLRLGQQASCALRGLLGEGSEKGFAWIGGHGEGDKT